MFVFVFLGIIIYRKTCKELMLTPVWPIREECDRKIASPQRRTQEPSISNDIFKQNKLVRNFFFIH